MIIEKFIQGPFGTNCYIVSCEKTNEAVIIDPSFDANEIIKFIELKQITPKNILLTHGHFDHCSGLGGLLNKFDIPVFIHKDDIPLISESKTSALIYGIKIPDIPLPGKFIQENDTFDFGNCTLKAIHTPGHSRGSICFLSEKTLFSGDTLFYRSIGRTDLPGGNHQDILHNITNKLYILDPNTIVYPGHGISTSIEDEKIHNPHTSFF